MGKKRRNAMRPYGYIMTKRQAEAVRAVKRNVAIVAIASLTFPFVAAIVFDPNAEAGMNYEQIRNESWIQWPASEPVTTTIPSASSDQTEESSSDSPAALPLPDPCGLITVVCDGEDGGEGAWVPRTVTAYTSRISETDGSPCISADGTNICEKWQDGELICGANFVPFGTYLFVEDVGVCIVRDRMNSRFPDRVDVYMGYDVAGALEFGKQELLVKVLEN